MINPVSWGTRISNPFGNKNVLHRQNRVCREVAQVSTRSVVASTTEWQITLLSMLECLFDKSFKSQFDELFGDLHVGKMEIYIKQKHSDRSEGSSVFFVKDTLANFLFTLKYLGSHYLITGIFTVPGMHIHAHSSMQT